MPPNSTTQKEADLLAQQRDELLRRLDVWLETPMLMLGLLWLLLLVVEFVWGLSPLLETTGMVIWAIFVLDFAVKFALAPAKWTYLKTNWLTALALLAPALRVLRLARVLRVARAARGLRLLRVVSSLNRGMQALGMTFARRGFGYVTALTTLVTLGGAAGIYAFEKHAAGWQSFGAALWWTAMLMTTMGSEYWPQTPEGRVLCFFLALYAFGVFGYVTATLATFFIGRDATDDDAELAGAREVEALRREVRALREELRAPKKESD